MVKVKNIDTDVGRALLRLRQERAQTLNQLSERSGVSPAMISRIENGNVSPSLNTLQALASAMAVSVMSLFSRSDDFADIHHVRKGEGLASRRISRDHAHDYEMLGRHMDPSGSFQSARIRLSSDHKSVLPKYQHEGYVFVYVVEGKATYSCGSENIEITAGDTLSFDAKLPHGFQKILSSAVEIITVNSRPA